ncbi:hypothetical protein B0I35DRAFT_117606 [Stachybotrys elegans]|uniref:Secreted protein n=1 Tax=Stachybotrys elegans TaxID=80388 RepID=A0A8K0SV31_9HYPO|nr:hypothetical protein B0I35DRAFT_117606 [Stachybotrys elegans]
MFQSSYPLRATLLLFHFAECLPALTSTGARRVSFFLPKRCELAVEGGGVIPGWQRMRRSMELPRRTGGFVVAVPKLSIGGEFNNTLTLMTIMGTLLGEMYDATRAWNRPNSKVWTGLTRPREVTGCRGPARPRGVLDGSTPDPHEMVARHRISPSLRPSRLLIRWGKRGGRVRTGVLPATGHVSRCRRRKRLLTTDIYALNADVD